MTNSSNPQSDVKATSPKDFAAKFAEKMADKIIRSDTRLEKFAATKAERASIPKTPEEIKSFFKQKEKIAAARTPEEKAIAVKSFYARKLEQKIGQEKSHFDEISNNPAYGKKSETELIKLSAFRNEFAKENKGLPAPQFEKAMQAFDKQMSKDGSLDAVEKNAHGIAAEKRQEKTTEQGMTH